MTRALRSRPFVRSKRLTDWGFGVDMLDQSISATGKILGTTSLTIGQTSTIVRIRGLLHVMITAASGIDEGYLGAAGIALVNTDAFGVGITAIPGPLTDAHWDNWMWHSFFDVRSITATIGDGVNSQSVSQRLIIDSKAMRKWDPAETLVLMVEGVESGTSILRVNGDSRILVKES